MEDGKTVMEKANGHSEITTGFKYYWDMPSFYHFEESPAFEALSYKWCLKTSIVQTNELFYSHKQLAVYLKLTDEYGSAISIEPWSYNVPNDPLFHSAPLHVKVSLFDQKGNLLTRPQECTLNEPLKEFLKKRIITVDNIEHINFNWVNTPHFLLRERGGGPIRMCFELSMVMGNDTTLVNTKSFNAMKHASANMKNLFDEPGKFSDFVIRTGDGREIRAHRAILNQTSPYFAAMFEENQDDAQKGEITVPVSHATMATIIRYLYTGEFPGKIGGSEGEIVKLFAAAKKYKVVELKDFIKENAVGSLFFVGNVCAELVQADMLGVLSMKAKAVDFIRANRKEVVKTEGWQKLAREHPDLVAHLFPPDETPKKKKMKLTVNEN